MLLYCPLLPHAPNINMRCGGQPRAPSPGGILEEMLKSSALLAGVLKPGTLKPVSCSRRGVPSAQAGLRAGRAQQ